MERKALLKRAHELDTSVEIYEKFYRFAKEYLINMKQRGNEDSSEFFEMLKYSQQKSEKVMYFWGIGSQNTNKANDLTRWCQHICRQKLEEMTIDDLTYLFACCAQITKSRNSIR